MQGHKQTCSGSSMMTQLRWVSWCVLHELVPYPNDIGGKDCMLILNRAANSAWFAREGRL